MSRGAGSGLDARAAAVLEAFVERLAPADEHAPGACALGVPRYIEGALGRSDEETRVFYRAFLHEVDERARNDHGTGFVELLPDEQDGVLRLIEQELADADQPSAFERVRAHLVEGLFADPAWGGNVDGGGWRLLGYPGPRAVWDAEAQRIETIGGS
jgi:hypothetical protein